MVNPVASLRGVGVSAVWPTLVPVAVLAFAAAFPPARLLALAVLVGGLAVSWRIRRPEVAAWAGTIPVAVSLSWGLIPLPPDATDGTTCASPGGPFATFRLIDGLLTLGALGAVYALVGRGTAELGLRRPSRNVAIVALLGAVAVGPVALVLGPPLSEPFFGPLPIRTGDLMAIVPATLFAVSNGVMEEVIYRGALQAWVARTAGVATAIAAQALVFGLAHGASQDFVASPIPVVALMIAGGLVAGWIVVRTGSLAIPIALHVAVDIPLYYGNACL
jgi:membrane protease YdiL (CAAX protease family)